MSLDNHAKTKEIIQDVSSIPEFEDSGNLPPGIYTAKWDEFKERFGHNHKRNTQLRGLEKAIEEFKRAGGTKIYVDGSFVTSKKNPGDYDALYDLDEIDDEEIDPRLLDATVNGREKQKRYYEGEFFPAYGKASLAGVAYLEFFRKDKKTKKSKGIVQIDLR